MEEADATRQQKFADEIAYKKVVEIHATHKELAKNNRTYKVGDTEVQVKTTGAVEQEYARTKEAMTYHKVKKNQELEATLQEKRKRLQETTLRYTEKVVRIVEGMNSDIYANDREGFNLNKAEWFNQGMDQALVIVPRDPPPERW